MIEAPNHVIATLRGAAVTEVPQGLYIPPDALSVLLDSFSGPLDLLLYFIRRQNIDIMDIPIVTITQQYIEYIRILEKNKLELAADYLVMAALLAEIKSKLLLPAVSLDGEEVEVDPRLELARRLLIYEQFKKASEVLFSQTIQGRDTFAIKLSISDLSIPKTEYPIGLSQLVDSMRRLLKAETNQKVYSIQMEVLSVKDRIDFVLACLQQRGTISFDALFTDTEGKMGVVVALLAVLELVKQAIVGITQIDPFEPITIFKKSHETE